MSSRAPPPALAASTVPTYSVSSESASRVVTWIVSERVATTARSRWAAHSAAR